MGAQRRNRDARDAGRGSRNDDEVGAAREDVESLKEDGPMTKQRFHLGAVLSMTTGMALGPDGIDGIYRIAAHLAGEPVWTHQMRRVMRESRPHLLAQFPALTTVSGHDVTPENHAQWLAAKVVEFGEWFDVAPMSADSHESIDPLSELAEKVHPDRIVTVVVDGPQQAVRR